MNKDQIKGAAKQGAGKAQEQVGKVTGSTAQQAKGLAKEAAGKLQKKVGNAREEVRDTDRKR